MGYQGVGLAVLLYVLSYLGNCRQGCSGVLVLFFAGRRVGVHQNGWACRVVCAVQMGKSGGDRLDVHLYAYGESCTHV